MYKFYKRIFMRTMKCVRKSAKNKEFFSLYCVTPILKYFRSRHFSRFVWIRSALHLHSSWKLLTNSWVSKARKRNENNRKQTSVLCKIVAIVLVQRSTICFANIRTNKIYVKLILNWLWNAHSSWPDILFAFPFAQFILCCAKRRMNWMRASM